MDDCSPLCEEDPVSTLAVGDGQYSGAGCNALGLGGEKRVGRFAKDVVVSRSISSFPMRGITHPACPSLSRDVANRVDPGRGTRGPTYLKALVEHRTQSRAWQTGAYRTRSCALSRARLIPKGICGVRMF